MERKSKTFAAEPGNVRSARNFVRGVLADSGRDIEQAILLTSELAANAIEHASSAIEVVVLVADEVLRVEVHDGFTMTEAFRVITETELAAAIDSLAPRGRGLWMVRTAAARFGVLDKGEDGKAVWFELTLA